MDIRFIYITAASRDDARTIGKKLVESRLAACVNIIDNMNSLYWWDGQIQDDREAVLIAKTTPEREPQLIETVRSIHSYDCPCIVSLPVTSGNPAFLKWVAEQVAAAA